MKHKITLFVAAFSLLYTHGVMHGMEKNPKAKMKPVTDLWAEQDTQYKLRNSEKTNELQKKIEKEQRNLLYAKINRHLGENETYILSNHSKNVFSSSKTKLPSIIKTNNSLFGSLITILQTKYANQYQYTAMTNFELQHLIGNENNQKRQQHKIEKSCQQALQGQESNIVGANFFIIAPQNVSFCKNYICELKNIVKTKLENISKITAIHYDHKNFMTGEVIVTLHPDTSELKIGDFTIVELR
jgi:hypothetical protein